MYFYNNFPVDVEDYIMLPKEPYVKKVDVVFTELEYMKHLIEEKLNVGIHLKKN